MKDEKKICVSYYEEAAQDYDFKRFNCQCQKLIDRVFKKTIYDFIKDKEEVLDAGTGTGRFARYFVGKNKKIIAMDASYSMLEKAKKKAEEEGSGKDIEFILGDVEAIPLKSNSVDAITCIHVLVHYRNTREAISEFSRVLKAGGSLIFEIADPRLAKFYNRLRCLFIGEKNYSYPDYYHEYKNIGSIMIENGFVMDNKRKIKKIPRFVIHLLLCKLKLKFMGKLIEWLENYNFGQVSIIGWKKIK